MGHLGIRGNFAISAILPAYGFGVSIAYCPGVTFPKHISVCLLGLVCLPGFVSSRAGAQSPPDALVHPAGLALELPAELAPGLPSGTAGQEAVPAAASSVALTLAEALEMAHRGNPRLHAAQAATREVRATELTARAYSNPSVEVYQGRQYARSMPTPGVPGLLQHYAAYQPVEIPRERAARRRTAQLATQSSEAAGKAMERSVEADVKHAFYAALRQREEIRHAQENQTLVEDLFRRVKVEVDEGEKGRLELTRAEAELASARFAVRKARLEYANAIAALRLATAGPPDVELDPRGELEQHLVLPPLAEMRASVLQSHPALAQSRADIDVAHSTLEQERAARIPQPTAFAEFENQPDLRYWRAGVTVPLPLFNRRRGQIEAAKGAIERTSAVLDQRQREISSALERSWEQYQLADQEVASLQAGSVRAAEKAVEAAQAAYRYGERSIVEVLDAQRVLQNTRGELLDAQFARQSALVDLEELGAVVPLARPE